MTDQLTGAGNGVTYKVTAVEILAAIRKKHSADAVVREVVISDPHEEAIRRRREIDRAAEYSVHRADLTSKRYEGLPIADAVPQGWSLRSSIPTRRIDALIFASTGITAVEIKVTRADFRRETPEKRRAWMSVTNRFVYVAPVGVIPRDEMPEGCGLWEYDPTAAGQHAWKHGLTAVVRAKVNKAPDPLPRQVLVALAYRVSNKERAS